MLKNSMSYFNPYQFKITPAIHFKNGKYRYGTGIFKNLSSN